ncbi:MAG TPA: HD domain-containing protein [Holophaga sp.]|nr:HD domain-containing protein [Holophaga sp.]
MSTPVPDRSAMQQAVEAASGACGGVLRAKDCQEVPPEVTFPISAALSDAFTLACQLHRNRPRTGKNTSYLNHLMAVAALVGESGGSEEEMVAALLHGALADGGGTVVLAQIRSRFGERVAEMILFCSDTETNGSKSPWLERKQAYLSGLCKAPLSALRVACADKLHNAHTIARDLKSQGPSVFDRFKGDREGTLWYYRSLARVFGSLVQDEPNLDPGFRAMIRELRETVAGLEN